LISGVKQMAKSNAIKEFIENRRIYFNQDCFRNLSRKQWTISYYTLRRLMLGKSTKDNLYDDVKRDFDDYVDGVIDKYKVKHEKYIAAIKKSKHHYWIFHKIRNEDKYRRTHLNKRAFASVVDYLIPLYLNIKTYSTDNMGQSHILSLTSNGQQLLKEWEEFNQQEDETSDEKEQ
jgi:tRNA-dihydrouridine synthase